MDKLVDGPGLGRRDAAELRIGDSLDFWKVIDLQPGQRLLLLAQMKVPGKAWIEFSLRGSELTQTAYFLPKGLGGPLYWWAMKPFHALIFGRMINQVVELAGRLSPRPCRPDPSLTCFELRFMLPPGGEMGPMKHNRACMRAEPKGKFLSYLIESVRQDG